MQVKELSWCFVNVKLDRIVKREEIYFITLHKPQHVFLIHSQHEMSPGMLAIAQCQILNIIFLNFCATDATKLS